MGQGGSWDDEEEPAAKNKHSQVFHLDLNAEELGQAYKQVIKEIRDEICELLKLERKNQDPLNCMPETVGGRLYTPLPRDNQPTFPVQVKGSDGEVVSFLFSWLDLYCGGFYAKEVYYLFQDFDLLMLPPPSQLNYKTVIGKGVVLLSGGAGYAAMGGRNINIGRPACYRYISALNNAGHHLINSTMEELRSGALAFPAVTISEPTRIAIWENWLVENMGEDEVPSNPALTYYFQHWMDMSKGLINETRFLEKSIDDLKVMLAVVKRTGDISRVQQNWLLPSKSKGKGAGKARLFITKGETSSGNPSTDAADDDQSDDGEVE